MTDRIPPLAYTLSSGSRTTLSRLRSGAERTVTRPPQVLGKPGYSTVSLWPRPEGVDFFDIKGRRGDGRILSKRPNARTGAYETVAPGVVESAQPALDDKAIARSQHRDGYDRLLHGPRHSSSLRISRVSHSRRHPCRRRRAPRRLPCALDTSEQRRDSRDV